MRGQRGRNPAALAGEFFPGLGKRRSPGQEEIEGAAEAVDVGTHIGPVGSHGLLRRDVVGRAGHGGAGSRRPVAVDIGASGGREAGQAEVENLDDAVRREHQVLRLDIAVDDVPLGGVLKAQRRLPHAITRLSNGQGAALGYHAVQACAGDELHDQKMNAAGLLGVVDGHDVGVGQPRGRQHLTAKLGNGSRAVHEALAHHLEGDRPFHQAMFRLEDFPHAAHAEQRGDPVARMSAQRDRHCGAARRRAGLRDARRCRDRDDVAEIIAIPRQRIAAACEPYTRADGVGRQLLQPAATLGAAGDMVGDVVPVRRRELAGIKRHEQPLARMPSVRVRHRCHLLGSAVNRAARRSRHAGAAGHATSRSVRRSR